jgi:signal transduction histidine kinase
MTETFKAPSHGPNPPIVPDAASLLADIGQLYNSRLQIKEIVGIVAKQAAERLGAECVFFWCESGREGFRPRGWYTPDATRMEHFNKLLSTFDRNLIEAAPLRGTFKGNSTLVPVIDSESDIDPVWDHLDTLSLIGTPISAGGSLYGLLFAIRCKGFAPFTAQDLTTMDALAPQAARALANATLLAEERWQRQKAELMFQASKAIHTELNFDLAVREIVLLLKQAIRSPWVGLFEVMPMDGPPTAMRLLGSTSEPAVELRICGAPWPLADWPTARALLDSTYPDIAIRLPAELAIAIDHKEGGWRAFPLTHKLGPQGMLVVCTPLPDAELKAESTEVASALAELVALAIMNQHLIEQEAKARIQIIRSQAAAQEREVLLRQIVHDLRNATQAMSLVVEDLGIEIGDNPQAQAGLSTIDSQIAFISNFLKEKLRWIQHGDRHGASQGAVLTDAFADLQARFGPAARARQQRLVVAPPEAIQVAVSAVQFEQIVGNLLDNAIKYTPIGGEVRLRADHSDGWVTVYVTDDGPGIPTSMQAHLGEVGYRGEHQGEGEGLGLANVRQLVTQGGGLFGFSTRPNLGTTFHVSLPTTLWGRILA